LHLRELDCGVSLCFRPFDLGLLCVGPFDLGPLGCSALSLL